MPQERWGPSWELRVLAGVQVIVDIGLLGVLMWFFFPHALLVPVMAVTAAVARPARRPREPTLQADAAS
jgi:hypothetical protein